MGNNLHKSGSMTHLSNGTSKQSPLFFEKHDEKPTSSSTSSTYYGHKPLTPSSSSASVPSSAFTHSQHHSHQQQQHSSHHNHNFNLLPLNVRSSYRTPNYGQKTDFSSHISPLNGGSVGRNISHHLFTGSKQKQPQTPQRRANIIMGITQRTYSERSPNKPTANPPITASPDLKNRQRLFSSNAGPPPTALNVSFNRGLYRSNSSLDLDHNEIENNLRREFGSASSIDALSSVNGESSFFSLLKEYRRDNILDQRSPAPPKIQEYLRGRVDAPSSLQNTSNALVSSCINSSETDGLMTSSVTSVTSSLSSNSVVSSSVLLEEATQSPRLRNKFQKLWESKSEKNSRSKTKVTEEKSGGSSSIFRKLRSSSTKNDTIQEQSSTNSSSTRLDDPEIRLEEKLRKKAFAHYDSQSVTANLNYASRLCHILNKRRNTTTGASAASMIGKHSDEEIDTGDGRSNEMVLSCPYFRNELGGEEERIICLNRTTSNRPVQSSQSTPSMLHRPNMSCGLALLENNNDRRWKLKSCPYQKLTNEKCFLIEDCDIGAMYYREHFYGLEHQNWFGIDENLGPIAISIRKERVVPPNSSENDHTSQNQIKHQYRLILRTSELNVLRGTVYEDCIPTLSSSRHNHHNNHHAKEVLEYIAPEICLNNLRLGVSTADEQLLKLDEQVLTRTYKVGVLYSKGGQNTEEEMYNNETAGPYLEEFLTCLGEKIRLKGFDKYRAGLDNKTDTTGLYSVYSTYIDCEIMFHVSTLLPYTPNNKQQLLRKRHIGNDIVTIVFQEPDALPFTPKTIRSQFQHVFIIVRVIPSTSNGVPTRYAVAVSRSKEVPVFGPPIPEKGIFTKSKAFTEFLLSKIINAENAAHRCEKFRSMAQRTRHEYLKDLAQNHVTSTTINDVSSGTSAGAKLVSTIFGSTRKSRSNRLGRDSHFIGDAIIKGAISWEMSVEDYGQSKVVDCLVAISSDTFIIVEEATKEIIFVCPNISILGWTSHPSYIKIFYHQGECVLLKCKDPDLDEIGEIVTRLKAVTTGCETQELILRRNSLGQLGFHVGLEGIVTEVENFSFAWQAGLTKNSRIVEICKIAIATLDHDQMIDLLKTSMTVTVTILPPNSDGTPKRGCNLQNCSYLTPVTNGNSGGDYENISMMLDRIQPSEYKNAASRSHTPNKQGVSLSVTPVPTKYSNNSSGSLPVSNDQNRAVSVTSPSVYSNVTHFISSPSSKPVYISPKNDINSAPISAPKLPPRGAHDHVAIHHVGNLAMSRSELSLANKKNVPISTVSASSTPLHHSRSHSHHFVKHTKNVTNTVSPPRQSNPSANINKVTSDYHSDTSSSNEWCSNSWSLPLVSSNLEVETNNQVVNVAAFNKDHGIYNRTKSPKVYNQQNLRGCVNDRIRVKSGSNKSSGSSCSGSSTSTSTLQEELLKLINPEYISDNVDSEANSSSGGETSTTQYSTPYSSLERTSNKDNSTKGDDVILTVAQPAQVISSEPSSPSDFQKERDPMHLPHSYTVESLSPSSSTSNAVESSLNIPITHDKVNDIDWPSFMESATKALANDDALDDWFKEFGHSLSSNNIGEIGNDSVRELEGKVKKLQSDLVKEQSDKASLAKQVEHLREENQRLFEESQTAAAQLKKFMEWFFQQNVNAK
ncbi:signal-induced proliferation-associated 1-like protein 2 [Dinothrombium tinctorium]|uniref:Signal-induced proliferation-associated 1-like protein 2 n=1 Tax=Dinothrombium tinctorium TaxID=1965070 RepID=A0A3S3PAQ8_9ACAR|nr:signal-induced proliferation-associated 1-like protein 2 [Dinothrombium tinctorium]RWS08755.1 signal-induced proliferation-associated 1-like protein 2 [Dinothrombium tinctorium]RWS10664.1 signal-induced proliferation-associated 1-like protein 2 [Dinothrombium tinctorium]